MDHIPVTVIQSLRQFLHRCEHLVTLDNKPDTFYSIFQDVTYTIKSKDRTNIYYIFCVERPSQGTIQFDEVDLARVRESIALTEAKYLKELNEFGIRQIENTQKTSAKRTSFSTHL